MTSPNDDDDEIPTPLDSKGKEIIGGEYSLTAANAPDLSRRPS
jgi:hypothetical protein